MKSFDIYIKIYSTKKIRERDLEIKKINQKREKRNTAT